MCDVVVQKVKVTSLFKLFLSIILLIYVFAY